jgi:hypothetical protein
MSDTPETDAELHAIKAVCKDEYMLDTMAEFARKLERERDEARELARQMSESNQVLMADVRFYRNAWEQLKKDAK